VKCNICEIGCRLGNGDYGLCAMYENRDGAIRERFPFTHIAAMPVSIETIPMTHFRPRTKFLQLGGIGCNFSCKGCVSDIFTHKTDRFAPALGPLTPGRRLLPLLWIPEGRKNHFWGPAGHLMTGIWQSSN